jgi:hypothetical protein
MVRSLGAAIATGTLTALAFVLTASFAASCGSNDSGPDRDASSRANGGGHGGTGQGGFGGDRATGGSRATGGGGQGGCASDVDAGSPSVGACALDLAAPTKKAPIVDVKADFGAKGDGHTDDTAAIQAAIDSLTSGGTVVFPSGTYLYGGANGSGASKVIHVRHDGVALWGDDGAELRSENSDAQEIALESKNTAIYGLLLTAPQFDRASAPNNHRVVLMSSGHEVVGNHINGGAAAGIFVYGADHFLIAQNRVENTEADSIHMTQGPAGPSHDGRVLQNTVRAPGPYWGDDEVAVIGYRGANDDPDSLSNANYNILIECNDLGDAGWGNGVDIGGAKDITIRKNSISGIHHAGGIKLGTEASYPTFSTENVIVDGNQITATETDGITKDGTRTGFGGIEVAARDPGSSVRKVLFTDNRVDGAANVGVRFEGILCDLGFETTVMTDCTHGGFGSVGTPTVDAMCAFGCKANTLDGQSTTIPLCKGAMMPTDVTGSSIPDPGPAKSTCR